MRRTRRRARVILRSILLHLLVLGLLGVGLFARMTESSDLQVASTRRASIMAALAVTDARRRGTEPSLPSVAAPRLARPMSSAFATAVPNRPSAPD